MRASLCSSLYTGLPVQQDGSLQDVLTDDNEQMTMSACICVASKHRSLFHLALEHVLHTFMTEMHAVVSKQASTRPRVCARGLLSNEDNRNCHVPNAWGRRL
eukprot:5713013-Amphidinium_carterae.2